MGYTGAFFFLKKWDATGFRLFKLNFGVIRLPDISFLLFFVYPNKNNKQPLLYYGPDVVAAGSYESGHLVRSPPVPALYP
jgi:hypothetical protein